MKFVSADVDVEFWDLINDATIYRRNYLTCFRKNQ